jgi:pimeloyl-ACP methyl ester carboxylesterase
LHRGQFGLIDVLAAQDIPFLLSTSEGMEESVNCADRQRLYDAGDGAEALRAHPDFSTLLLLSYVGNCATWRVPSLPASFNNAVHSSIPTLVYADQYDPITPPAYSEGASDALRESTFVQFPGLGHGALFSGQACPNLIFHAFVDQPDRTPDRSCVSSMGPPHWH